DEQGYLNVLDRGADILRAVAHRVDVDRAWDRLGEPRQQGLDLIDDLDGVGADFALDQQQFGPSAVEPGAGARIDRGVDDLGNIADLDRGAILVGQDDAAKVVGIE